jgi:arylsulfatase A-like enzyme
MRRWFTIALCALSVAAGLLWWRRDRPNVLIITVDSLRPDYLSCYGSTAVNTPYIDALAAAGIRFDQAVCDSPLTRPSSATLLTGRDSAAHRVRSPIDRLGVELPTLAESLHQAGYRTAAIVSIFDLDAIYRLDRGFAEYDDVFTSPVNGLETQVLHLASVFHGDAAKDRSFRHAKLQLDSMRRDKQTTDAALGFLQRAGSQPFFLWVHYFGARERWHDGADVRALAAEYPSLVQGVDVEVGRLLRGFTDLALHERTITVLHGDHGQSLLERDVFGHGFDLSEQAVRVPLIISWPGRLPHGRNVRSLASLADVFPTIAAIVGLSMPPGDGHSLLPLIEGRADAGRTVYIETFLPATVQAAYTARGPAGGETHIGAIRRGARSERWKYVRSEPHALIDIGWTAIVDDELRRSETTEELYDLLNDPGETTNVVGREPAVARELRDWLDRHVKEAERESGR